MKTTIRITCAFALIILLGACSRHVSVKIGVAAPMSGPLAQYGKDIANGAQIAVEELNSDYFTIGGKRAHFELVLEDDQASPDAGKAAAQRLVDAGVAAVFGHFNSGVTIAAAPLYAQAGIPQLSVSTNPTYTRMGLKTAFRITADDIQQGAALARLITGKLHAKSLYVVDDGTLFGVGIADEVERTVKARLQATREGVDAKSADYAALARNILGAHADTVFFGGDEAAGLPLLSALRAAGSSARFVVADAMCDASTVKGAHGNADANYYCTVAGVPPSWLSSGIGFMELYKGRFNAPAGAYSALSYDGIHVLAQAMREAGSAAPQGYLAALAKGSFSGKIQGTIEFDGKGDVKDGTVVIYQAVDGKLVEQRSL